MTESRINAAEGRAIAARPSLCLLICLALLVLAALATPPAQAAPFKPVLTGTNPGSPGASLAPRIQGREGGIVSSVVRTSATGRGPVGRGLNPDAIITIYEDDPTCLDAGAVVATGTVEELEDVGILIPNGVIDADSVTTFYATQTDDSGTSPCSLGVKYRQVTTPPEPPVFGSVTPASPADDNLPRLIGTADPEATVSIFSNATCAGAPLGSDTGAVFGGSGIQVPVADNSTTTFYAGAVLAGIFSGCSSSSLSYQEVTAKQDPPKEEPPKEEPPKDNPGGNDPGKNKEPVPGGKPPVPKVRTVPGGTANNNTPLVTGTAPSAANVLIYADPKCDGPPVAKGSLDQFLAGLPVRVLDNAVAIFSAVSTAGGKASGCSDPVVYTEDSTTPRTRITMAPGAKTAKRKAVVRFVDTTGNTPGTTFLCRVDKRKWKQCVSPLRMGKLRFKRYMVQVKAIDPAGNAEGRGAKRSFKVIPRP